MVRAVGCLEILKVTSDAERAGQLVIIVDVALVALDRGMESGKRPTGGRMIKRCSEPRGCAVAHGAVRREAYGRVRRIVSGVEIAHVARSTLSVRSGQLVVAINVTLLTGNCRVKPGENPTCACMIESGIAPVGRVMALLAALRKVCLHMVGIRRALEIFQVAGSTRGARKLVIVVHMALRAGRAGVCTS